VAVRGLDNLNFFANNKSKYFFIIGITMTVIRLTRMGRKKQPFYRIAVTDSRKRRDGGWIELIGYYNPMTKEIKVDSERVDYWLSVGAQMSDRVKKITGR
jgi:small subunit ribosomal protein S16